MGKLLGGTLFDAYGFNLKLSPMLCFQICDLTCDHGQLEPMHNQQHV